MTDSFGARKTLAVRSTNYQIHRLDSVKGAVETLPYTLKILLENLLRFEDGENITAADITALANWDPKAEPDREISFTPARVVLQDFTGVPAVVDLAAMRDAVVKLGGKASMINPLSPAELVIDHSVQVDHFGTKDSLAQNNAIEFERNQERYGFLRWGQNGVSELPRRAAEHGHRAPGEPRVPEPRGVRETGRQGSLSRIRTRSSARTRTRR